MISNCVDPLVAGHYDPIHNPYRRDMSQESRATDAEQGKLLPKLMLDVAARREVMRRMGVDFQVIAPAPRSSITGLAKNCRWRCRGYKTRMAPHWLPKTPCISPGWVRCRCGF